MKCTFCDEKLPANFHGLYHSECYEKWEKQLIDFEKDYEKPYVRCYICTNYVFRDKCLTLSQCYYHKSCYDRKSSLF